MCDLYGMTRYESFTHTPQPPIIRRIFTSLAVRILNFIRHCFAYKMNGNTTRMVRCWNYRNFVNSVLLFYSQFESNKLSVICGRRVSFITIASIGFLKWFTTEFLHFSSCILPSIIRHILLHRGLRSMIRCMAWPWFGHSSLNHNEYAVCCAVSSVKMPPVPEYASSLIFFSLNILIWLSKTWFCQISSVIYAMLMDLLLWGQMFLYTSLM